MLYRRVRQSGRVRNVSNLRQVTMSFLPTLPNVPISFREKRPSRSKGLAGQKQVPPASSVSTASRLLLTKRRWNGIFLKTNVGIPFNPQLIFTYCLDWLDLLIYLYIFFVCRFSWIWWPWRRGTWWERNHVFPMQRDIQECWAYCSTFASRTHEMG